MKINLAAAVAYVNPFLIKNLSEWVSLRITYGVSNNSSILYQ